MKLWAVKIKSEDDVLTFVLDFLFLVYNIYWADIFVYLIGSYRFEVRYQKLEFRVWADPLFALKLSL